jgi:C_GCAxxG_C_C family probable redox protein
MIEEVSVRKVIEDAEENFRKGYFCSEGLLDAICKNFGYDDSVVKLSTGLRGGLASGCLCGAVSGGALALGMVFGRSERTPHDDPRSAHTAALCKELHDWFKGACGKNSTCCRVLIREFDASKGEQRPQCIRFTGMCAGKVAEIIIREKGLKNLDGE